MNTQQHTIAAPPLPICINANIPLKERTWFKTGGPAEYFAQPTNAVEFQEALLFASHHNLPVTLLGHGANTLISDEGIKGLVISPLLNTIVKNDISNSESLVCAGAGVGMPELINYCLENNLTGLEEFSGIPGSVGGSVYINLHYFEFLLSQFLVEAEVIHAYSAVIETVNNEWFAFGYNNSRLHQGDYYLVNATFKLKRVSDIDTAYARGRSHEIIRHRASRYPKKNTCGSFFRNFFEDEVTIISNGKKMIYVAYYLDKVGVKGQLCSGNAIVSYQHANMIVNQGSASSADIINLARAMQQLVFDNFGIMPIPECRLLGFDSYPLLPSPTDSTRYHTL